MVWRESILKRWWTTSKHFEHTLKNSFELLTSSPLCNQIWLQKICSLVFGHSEVFVDWRSVAKTLKELYRRVQAIVVDEAQFGSFNPMYLDDNSNWSQWYESIYNSTTMLCKTFIKPQTNHPHYAIYMIHENLFFFFQTSWYFNEISLSFDLLSDDN